MDETDYMSPDRASVIAMLTLARTRSDEVPPWCRPGHGEAPAGGAGGNHRPARGVMASWVTGAGSDVNLPGLLARYVICK